MSTNTTMKTTTRLSLSVLVGILTFSIPVGLALVYKSGHSDTPTYEIVQVDTTPTPDITLTPTPEITIPPNPIVTSYDPGSGQVIIRPINPPMATSRPSETPMETKTP